MLGAAIPAFRVKWAAPCAYPGDEDWSQLVGLSFCLITVEEEEPIQLQVSKRQEIITIRADINRIENRNTMEKISETKNWFFETIDKIDKPLDRTIKTKQHRQFPNIKNERINITTFYRY